jgi:hypothetical protein
MSIVGDPLFEDRGAALKEKVMTVPSRCSFVAAIA